MQSRSPPKQKCMKPRICLKRSELLSNICLMRELARAEICDYIEVFYNPSRRHSHLSGVSPEAFDSLALNHTCLTDLLLTALAWKKAHEYIRTPNWYADIVLIAPRNGGITLSYHCKVQHPPQKSSKQLRVVFGKQLLRSDAPVAVAQHSQPVDIELFVPPQRSNCQGMSEVWRPPSLSSFGTGLGLDG